MNNLSISRKLSKSGSQTRPRLAELDDFPGWNKVGGFIKSLILAQGAKAIGDVGGGRLPRIDLDFVAKNALTYNLFDISSDELAQADDGYRKIVMDVCCDDRSFAESHAPQNLDLIFSHMLLEHLPDPLQAHRNFFKMLRPGGLSVHLFASKSNFPLFVNGFIPELLWHAILKLLQPHRDTSGEEGKFEALYRMCGAPTGATRRAYQAVGFEVVQHTSYVGHEYYKRIKPLAAVERALRPVIVKMDLPMVSANLLILQRPLGSAIPPTK
jgi:SAM-dependent methyltransferase